MVYGPFVIRHRPCEEGRCYAGGREVLRDSAEVCARESPIIGMTRNVHRVADMAKGSTQPKSARRLDLTRSSVFYRQVHP
jgi:hypothetical protein